VQLPAAEIGWCGFHGFGVWLVRLKADDSGWFVSVWADVYTRMRIVFGFFYALYPIAY
jgi:hypothetical protein